MEPMMKDAAYGKAIASIARSAAGYKAETPRKPFTITGGAEKSGTVKCIISFVQVSFFVYDETFNVDHGSLQKLATASSLASTRWVS